MFENRFYRWVNALYSPFIKAGSNLQSLFLLYMRVVWGHQLFLSGVAKFSDIDQVTQFFTSLDLVYPAWSAYVVATLETVCGVLLFFGFASRLTALVVIVIMATAFSTAHAHVFFDFKFLFNPSLLVHEAPYPFLVTALLVFIFGPGRVSLDGWIKRWAQAQAKY